MANKTEEGNLRKDFKKAVNLYSESMLTYDQDLFKETRDNSKCQDEYEETHAELEQAKEELQMRIDERRKREQMDEIMGKMEAEQNAKKDKLVKASAYIQAHWRGMLERKVAEKWIKKNRKKKKKRR